MSKILITLNDQGGEIILWNYEELVGSLRASMGSSHPPIVVVEDENIFNSNRKDVPPRRRKDVK